MRFLLTLFLLLPLTVGATTYTEFYVQTTGSNLNSGHTTDDAATYSATGGNWTNNTSATTGTWFKTGESLAAVTNGAWAALYTDGTTTNAQYVGLITAVDDAADTITLSLQNYCGANPSTVVAGMSIKVGGAWKGMTTNTMANGGGFPFNFLSATATNAQNVFPRCNIKGGTAYSVASAITHANVGPIRFQGYTTTPGDGGKAEIDGPATGTSFIVLTVSGANNDFVDLIFAYNGDSGTAATIVTTSGTQLLFHRCVFHHTRRGALSLAGAYSIASECEVYSGNIGNAGPLSLLAIGGQSMGLRCISHDNTTANSIGIGTSGSGIFLNCISYSNGNDGFQFAGNGIGGKIIGCDAYANGGDGIDFTSTTAVNAYIENCNLLKNTGFGINSSGGALRNGAIVNCAFGSGTYTNSGGNISGFGGVLEDGSIIYAANTNPWTDPDNGNFRISLAAAKAAGRGLFTQNTINSPTNTVAYHDIGAAQSASTNATTGGGSYPFAQ